MKQINEYGFECWYARDLQEVLEYKRWDKFLNVIDKAKEACKNSGLNEEDHFSHVGKMINLAKTAQREIDDIMLSRYACYLIVQNADPGTSSTVKKKLEVVGAVEIEYNWGGVVAFQF